MRIGRSPTAPPTPHHTSTPHNSSLILTTRHTQPTAEYAVRIPTLVYGLEHCLEEFATFCCHLRACDLRSNLRRVESISHLHYLV